MAQDTDAERQKAVAEMQRLITQGLESGPATPFDMDAFIAKKMASGGE